MEGEGMVYAMEPPEGSDAPRACVYFCDRFRRYKFDAAAGGKSARAAATDHPHQLCPLPTTT